MPTVPCLAYLLDTPVEPGAVVTYRCSRPAGHAPAAEHEDADAGRTWTSTDDVAWATGAVYPAHTGYPWDDTPAVPPMTATPTPTDTTEGATPWAQLRADAVALIDTDTLTAQPAEELP